MNNKFKTFGFKTVVINGFSVFTCNISIGRIDKHNYSGELPKIDGVSIIDTERLVGKKGSNRIRKEMSTFSYTTTNAQEHYRMQQEIGLFLEQYAMHKLKAKYQWAHPEDIKPKYEYISPTDDLCF
jgi:hypothetical protein